MSPIQTCSTQIVKDTFFYNLDRVTFASAIAFPFQFSVGLLIQASYLANESQKDIQLSSLLKMAPSDSAHEDAPSAHLCKSVSDISIMIFADLTYIDTILRFRPNDATLHGVLAPLEKLACLVGKQLEHPIQQRILGLSMKYMPVSMETVVTKTDPAAPEYRTAKARFLSQALSYAIELIVFDGSKSRDPVLDERIKQLTIVRNATITQRRIISKS